MEHPDFNMTPVAGTSFMSGESQSHREWAESKNLKEVFQFHKKFNIY